MATPDTAATTSLQTIQFDDTTQVAPGLVVRYKTVPRADTVVVRDPGDIPIAFTIEHQHKVIYRDKTDGYSYNDADREPAVRKLYPLWVPTGRDSGELLIDIISPPNTELSRRFFIRNASVVKLDTIPLFHEPAKNLDRDKWLELAGYSTFGEEWSDEQGRQWQTYNPKLYYEIRPTGLMLDSALTKQQAISQYGVFRGFTASDEPVIRIKKPEQGASPI
ncbi:hypothetical protein [Hymenobacter sp. BRD67]|uniref:hypothetical protein n=1 Tax=Hymenobacter sp. BRD67 TaxID=2675877 RepID=UPI0015678D45|nr:hypothetical protein [Hymenobacter sp. BRD67]QKG52541.1 hypothetical protein GKZ67_07945 [Hymenobacter sp. BRD67]